MDDDTKDLNILSNEVSDDALEAAGQTEREAWAVSKLKFSNIPWTTSSTLGSGCCSGISQ